MTPVVGGTLGPNGEMIPLQCQDSDDPDQDRDSPELGPDGGSLQSDCSQMTGEGGGGGTSPVQSPGRHRPMGCNNSYMHASLIGLGLGGGGVGGGGAQGGSCGGVGGTGGMPPSHALMSVMNHQQRGGGGGVGVIGTGGGIQTSSSIYHNALACHQTSPLIHH